MSELTEFEKQLQDRISNLEEQLQTALMAKVKAEEQLLAARKVADKYRALHVSDIQEILYAYDVLAMNGVPRERARNVPNGIDVLITRMRRETRDLRHELQVLKIQHDEYAHNYVEKPVTFRGPAGE